ncbi:MAG: hypothetical protein ACKVP3_27025 [Hyphomicrobiaceae bacterium]
MISSDKTPEVMEMRELSLDEIDDISGAGRVGDFFKNVAKKIKGIFGGGDQRRPTDRPGTPGVPPT